MATLQITELGRKSRACANNARQWEERSTLNVPLLRSVQEAILETPQQFTMLRWRRGDVFPGAQDKTSGQACIASWAVVLSDRVRLSTLTTSRIMSRASEALGVRPLRSHHLFWLHSWPEEFYTAYIEEPSDYGEYLHNARLAVARIDAFIEVEEQRRRDRR